MTRAPFIAAAAVVVVTSPAFAQLPGIGHQWDAGAQQDRNDRDLDAVDEAGNSQRAK